MDDLVIETGNRQLSGWQQVSVERGIERVPSTFNIAATERFPDPSEISIEPGAACHIRIGGDLVLTGFIDRVAPSISIAEHSIRILGRSRMQDLVDCSITADEIHHMEIVTSSLVTLARKLAAPYHIAVIDETGTGIPLTDPNGTGPLAINAILTETPYEILERIARYAGVLVYDDVDGNLVLSGIGTRAMASGVAQGQNVQSATTAFSMDQRYSDYIPALMSYEMFKSNESPATFAPVKDPSVKRHRPLMIISEQFNQSGSLAVQRARWEMARRYGRSQVIRAVVDSWRDASGRLWEPNTTIDARLPALKLRSTGPYVIADVIYNRDDATGTTATLTLMPPDAFAQQPTYLTTFLGPHDWTPGAP